jgi:hypothetical protein
MINKEKAEVFANERYPFYVDYGATSNDNDIEAFMEGVKYCDPIVTELIDSLQWFVDSVDKSNVLPQESYDKFKQLLEKYNVK